MKAKGTHMFIALHFGEDSEMSVIARPKQNFRDRVEMRYDNVNDFGHH